MFLKLKIIKMEPDRRWHLIQYKFQEHNIIKTFELFREHRIEPILIKGWAAARNYPLKEERLFADIDVCVAPGDYVKAGKILAGDVEKKLPVDLHDGLRHLDTLDWNDLFAKSELVKLQEIDVRVLGPEDHLRVLCVHWLSDGASNKERLRDIFYAVENRPTDFDWDRCLNVVDPKRRKWVVSAIGLAHRYLGLELKTTPIAAEAESIPKWMIETVEKEWADENPLRRLNDCLADRKELFRQLKKRFPPNAIQATVQTDGDFDDKPRIFYQIENIFFRIKPSIQRMLKTLFAKSGVLNFFNFSILSFLTFLFFKSNE